MFLLNFFVRCGYLFGMVRKVIRASLKIFTLSNFLKVCIIFIVGLVSRVFINWSLEINVFVDYFNPFSLLYYFVFGMFVTFVHEMFRLFESELVDVWSKGLFSSIGYVLSFKWVNFGTLSLKSLREVFSLSFIRRVISCFNNNNNLFMGMSGDMNDDSLAVNRVEGNKVGNNKGVSCHKDRVHPSDKPRHVTRSRGKGEGGFIFLPLNLYLLII